MEEVGELLGAFDLQLSKNNGCSLWGETFVNFSVEDADFTDGDFDCANFKEITFRNCQLVTTSLDKTTFLNVTFIGCDLSGSSILSSDLAGVVFLDCNLDGVALDDSDIRNVTIDGCEGQVSFDGTNINTCVISDCNISRSTFLGTTLNTVSFTESNLSGTEFGAMCRFESCLINECDITHIDLVESIGVSELELRDCSYQPFIINPQGNSVPNQKAINTQLGSDSRFNIYGNWGDESAHIYCSSIIEFRNTQCH